MAAILDHTGREYLHRCRKSAGQHGSRLIYLFTVVVDVMAKLASAFDLEV